MKAKKYLSYLLIILLFFTFYFVNSFFMFKKGKKEIEVKPDVLVAQHNLEQKYLKDLETNDYQFDNLKVILNPYGNSPLTALLMFKTEKEEEIEIKVMGSDDKTTICHTFPKEKTHLLPLYGLYPDCENQVIVSCGDLEKEVIIETEPLLEGVALPNRVLVKKEKVNNDLFFVSPSSKGYVTAYDINGDVRWYLTENYSWDIQRLANGHLLVGSDRLINPPYYTVGFLEMDLSGKIYNEYILPGGYHHDVFEMENGDFLVASNNFDDLERGTTEDYVVLLNRTTGEIEKTWDISKIIPKEEGKSASWIEHDWFHNNAVWYDEKTNSITLSGRHQDAVINIDYDSGDLNWIIGDNTNWKEDMQKYFFTPLGEEFEWQWAQHAAMVLPNGNIFLFDNGNNKSKIKENYVDEADSYSRGVIYDINPDEMTITQVWQYGKERGRAYYSPYICDVDYYKEGHYLVHSGGVREGGWENAILKSFTTEILDDEVIFEIELPSNFYRAEKLSLYSENNLKFGKGKQLGNFSKTLLSEDAVKLSKTIKEIPKDNNLKIYKEKDRLVVNGDFKKGSEVYLILDKPFSKKVYQIFISARPYTVMCIGIFETPVAEREDILNINYYVNNEGLSGIYNIYLKIDEKIYDIEQYVDFD